MRLDERQQAFCLGMVTAIVVVVGLHIAVLGIATWPSYDAYSHNSKKISQKIFALRGRQATAETLSFTGVNQEPSVVIRDYAGQPLTAIANARAVAWSPCGKYLLVHREESGLFQTVALKWQATGDLALTNCVEFEGMAARFTADSSALLITTNDYQQQTIALHEMPVKNTVALANED
jgi:hypothetical protein